MFWNKKKNRGLPDLPTPQVISPKIQKKEEISSLPSFPDAPSKKGFSQEVIKDAIGPIGDSLPIPREKPIKMTKEISLLVHQKSECKVLWASTRMV